MDAPPEISWFHHSLNGWLVRMVQDNSEKQNPKLQAANHK
jgi:hypothetical protein